ncbi:MAG: PQQ-binding-like beta-propeller repeat protein [Planctomycetota bacterium]
MRGLLMAAVLVCGMLTAICREGLAQTPPTKPAAEWPQFLGPQRNGISPETGLLQTWPADGPKEVWRTAGGPGMSGLVISRGRVVTLVHRDGKQSVIALDARTGKPQWETAVAPEYHNGMGNGPRATPAIAGEQVFVFTGEGILAALNLNDGKPAWSKNVVKDLEGEIAEYGMASSPLVVGQHVIVTAGAPNAAVVAYDIKTGKLAWKTDDGAAGYSSPTLLNVGGRSQIVASTGGAILGMSPDKGSLLWKYPFETNYNCNIATPLAVNGQVFISAGENHGSVLLALKPQKDQFEAKEVWSSLGTKSVLRNEWQTSILHDGHLYGFDNVGAAGPVTHLTCINAETGVRVWQKLRFGKGNLMAADGKLFATTMNGELVMIRLNPTAYEELGRATILGSTRQAPALANGLLYLRDDKEIVCLDVRQP